MIKLSVNVNKIATLRNSRGGAVPDPAEFSRAAIKAGAHGITVHPRPDERHIRRTDVSAIRGVVPKEIEFNIEGYPDRRYMDIIRENRPDQATLVPDPPDVLTSNAGWDVKNNVDLLKDIVAELKDSGARVSLFLEPDESQIDAVLQTGADRIELYTEHFARAFERGEGKQSYEEYAATARRAQQAGIGVNAGHDLTLANLILMRNLPGLLEVSIGHCLVIDALWMGWEASVKAYLNVLKGSEVTS